MLWLEAECIEGVMYKLGDLSAIATEFMLIKPKNRADRSQSVRSSCEVINKIMEQRDTGREIAEKTNKRIHESANKC